MKTTTTFAIATMSLLAFASCDQSPSLSSAPGTAPPSAEEAQQQALARQRATKSKRLGQDYGANAVGRVLGIATALGRRPQVPTQSEMDDFLEKAIAEAKSSESDLDVDADAFRAGYMTAFKLGFRMYQDENKPAF